MNLKGLNETLRQIQNSDVIWAEIIGGKLDGKFIPLWISHAAANQMLPGAGFVKTRACRIPLFDVTATEILRAKIEEAKGVSATWPDLLEMQRETDETYIAQWRR